MVDLAKALAGSLGGKVAPKEEVVDSCLREERSWLVLLLRVEDFSEMKASQRTCWQAGDGCPGETPKEVGVHKATIDGRLEKQRARLTTQREAPPLWNPYGSFANNGGDAEAQMVGQGLCRSIEAALEWRADYARGEERVLYYLSRP
jgi:hypothetical protein